jgi:hypothetical protein
MRRHRGELGDQEIVASGDRRYAVGDEITARMGDRNLHPDADPASYVRNGARGVVTAVFPERRPHEDRIEVAFDGIGTIRIPRSFLDEHTDQWGRTDVGIDHAYAVTSYAVEGLTFDQSSSHVDPQSTRPEVYVDITRGRNENHVFVTRSDDPLDGERLPAVPALDVDRQLGNRLSVDAGEPVAIDLDPEAGDMALALLDRAARSGTASAAAQVARQATARPDPVLVAQLGGEPDEPCLAERYRELLADIALYRQRHQVRPGRQGPWAWALGLPAHDAEGERDTLKDRLAAYAVEVAQQRLGGGSLDEAAVDTITWIAARGHLGAVDYDLARAELTAGCPSDDALRRAARGHQATQTERPGREQIGVP